MNDRIKQLAEQARSWAEVSYKKQNEQFISHWDTPIGYTPTQFFEQKFAELIVRECANIANEQFSVASGLRDRDCWTAAEIKKHFGVKE